MSQQIKNEFDIKKVYSDIKKEYSDINSKEGTCQLMEEIKEENEMEINCDFKLEIKEEPLRNESFEADFELSDIDLKEEPFGFEAESFTEEGSQDDPLDISLNDVFKPMEEIKSNQDRKVMVCNYKGSQFMMFVKKMPVKEEQGNSAGRKRPLENSHDSSCKVGEFGGTKFRKLSSNPMIFVKNSKMDGSPTVTYKSSFRIIKFSEGNFGSLSLKSVSPENSGIDLNQIFEKPSTSDPLEIISENTSSNINSSFDVNNSRNLGIHQPTVIPVTTITTSDSRTSMNFSNVQSSSSASFLPNSDHSDNMTCCSSQNKNIINTFKISPLKTCKTVSSSSNIKPSQHLFPLTKAGFNYTLVSPRDRITSILNMIDEEKKRIITVHSQNTSQNFSKSMMPLTVSPSTKFIRIGPKPQLDSSQISQNKEKFETYDDHLYLKIINGNYELRCFKEIKKGERITKCIGSIFDILKPSELTQGVSHQETVFYPKEKINDCYFGKLLKCKSEESNTQMGVEVVDKEAKLFFYAKQDIDPHQTITFNRTKEYQLWGCHPIKNPKTGDDSNYIDYNISLNNPEYSEDENEMNIEKDSGNGDQEQDKVKSSEGEIASQEKNLTSVSKEDCHISAPVSGSEDCQSENGSSVAISLLPGSPKDLLHDFPTSSSPEVCSKSQLQNDNEDTKIIFISECEEIGKDFCNFNSTASPTETEFRTKPDEGEIDMDDPDCCPSTFTESSVSSEKNSDLSLSHEKSKVKKYSDTHLSTTSNSKVKVQNLQESKARCRKNYCPYCQIPFTHLPRHMIRKHRLEKKVQEFLSFSSNSKERNVILEELRKLGNFKHNSSVINNKEGEILTTIRPKKRESSNNFVPCRNCLGFYPKALLWRHNKRCKNIYKVNNFHNSRLVGHGLNLLTSNENCSLDFMERVIAPMNCDDINRTVRNDILILKLGESMFSKNPEHWKFRYYRNAMRQMARLLIIIRDIDKSISSLSDVINPTKFQSLVLATKNLAGYDGQNSFDHGSLVLKVGMSIKKCAEILSGMSLDDGNENLANSCELFIKRLDREWSSSISALALRDIHKKKVNKPKFLSFVEDFQKLNKYISENIENVSNDLTLLQNGPKAMESQKPLIQKLCMDLMNLTLSSLILFNRRRSGETERIMVDHYKGGLQTTSTCEDLCKSLNPSKEILCKYFRRIEIPDKRGNKVPVILSNHHVSCIDLMLAFKDYIGASTENKFLFPRPNYHSLNPISGVKSLKDIVKKANLKQPEIMFSTSLRKHMATMSRLLNLSQQELEELYKQMGQDIRIHTSCYRLSDDAVQLGKITRALLAAQNGNILEYKNEQIEDIELDLEEFMSDDEATENDTERAEVADTSNKEINIENYEKRKTDSKNDTPATSTRLKTSLEVRNRRKICRPQKGIYIRRPFSRAEKKKVEEYFKDFIKEKKLPGKKDCTEFLQSQTKFFKERTWLHLKNYVRNKIVSVKI